MRNAGRLAAKAFAAATSVVAVLLLLSFALPVTLWRTGEHALPPLDYRGDVLPLLRSGDVLWIDTDAACGTGRHRDPDDCFALVSLFVGQRGRIAGVSTVFGNGPIEVTDSTTRAVANALGPYAADVRIWRGCANEMAACGRDGASLPPAHDAFASALRQRALTFVALGPLTNLATAIHREPELGTRLIRVIAVMGRRPGHIFHPSEGRGAGALLFGHGPVFRDLNVDLDQRAVEVVLKAGVELILLPYAAARDVLLSEADLRFISNQGPAGAMVAMRSRDWLEFWRREVGLDGFYPFDLMAAAYLEDASRFQCADVMAWVGRDPALPWYPRSDALLVSQHDDLPAKSNAVGKAVYCDEVTRKDLQSLFIP